LGVGIAAIVLAYHFWVRVSPGLEAPWSRFDVVRALPYVVLLGGVVYLAYLSKNRADSYAEFLRNSPGMNIDTADIEYGVGHGVPAKALKNP
jgi:hypothetical protein